MKDRTLYGSVLFVSCWMKGRNFMYWANKKRRMAERARELFPLGTRIQLIHMDAPYHPIPEGTTCTVRLAGLWFSFLVRLVWLHSPAIVP